MGYVFISYSSQNQDIAYRINEILNKNDIETWMAPNDIPVGFEYAQVTGGGIELNRFNCETMQSTLCKGLYACGEVLDVTGDCGGFNLQWAWTSGYKAGLSAAKSIKR